MKYVFIAAVVVDNVVVDNDAVVLIAACGNATMIVEYDIVCMILMG